MTRSSQRLTGWAGVILHIIKKEIYENFLSLRFSITSILCFLVVTASIVILGKAYVDDQYDYTRNAREYAEYIKDISHPWHIIYRGIPVEKPVSKLSMFNKGIDDTGRSARIYGYREAAYYIKKGKNPVNFLFPAMDLLFFVSVIMSLLAIVFSYDAVSGEKFNETLKLMVSYPVHRVSIIIGKWIGGYACLLLPFVLSCAGGMLTLLILVPDIRFSSHDFLKLLMFTGFSFLYISIIYTFGLLVSSSTARPSTSITVLLLVWVVFILVIPNISTSAASFFVTTDTVQEVEEKKRDIMQNAREEYRKKRREYWRDASLQKTPFRVYRRMLDKERYVQIRRGIHHIQHAYRLDMAAQTRLAKWISRLSPLASLTYAAGAVTGSGYEESESFRIAVDEYERRIMNFAYDEWIKRERDRERVRSGLQSKPRWEFDAEHAPAFNYAELRQSGLSHQIAGVFIDAGLLVCWNVIFLLLTYIFFIRYDVK